MNNITSGVDVCGKLVLLSYDKGGPYTKKFCADLRSLKPKTSMPSKASSSTFLLSFLVYPFSKSITALPASMPIITLRPSLGSLRRAGLEV